MTPIMAPMGLATTTDSRQDGWSTESMHYALGLEHYFHAESCHKEECDNCHRQAPRVSEVRFTGKPRDNERWCLWCIGMMHLRSWRKATPDEETTIVPVAPGTSWGSV